MRILAIRSPCASFNAGLGGGCTLPPFIGSEQKEKVEEEGSEESGLTARGWKLGSIAQLAKWILPAGKSVGRMGRRPRRRYLVHA